MAANDSQEADAPHYLVEWTEPALLEADAAYLWFSGQQGPEYAIRWYEGLFPAAQSLSSLPKVHPIAAENDRYNVINTPPTLSRSSEGTQRYCLPPVVLCD